MTNAALTPEPSVTGLSAFNLDEALKLLGFSHVQLYRVSENPRSSLEDIQKWHAAVQADANAIREYVSRLTASEAEPRTRYKCEHNRGMPNVYTPCPHGCNAAATSTPDRR